MRVMVLITDSLFGPYFRYTRNTRLPSSSLALKLAMKPSSFRMRAISSFSFEAGTSIFWWRALCALRMRAKKSATGSVKLMFELLLYSFSWRDQLSRASAPGTCNFVYHLRLALPGRLGDARDLALQCQSAETQPAHAELPHECPRTSAQFAAAFLPRGKLRFLCQLSESCFCSHRSFSLADFYCARNGMPKCFSSERAWLSLLAVVTMVTFMPFSLSTLA